MKIHFKVNMYFLVMIYDDTYTKINMKKNVMNETCRTVRVK